MPSFARAQDLRIPDLQHPRKIKKIKDFLFFGIPRRVSQVMGEYFTFFLKRETGSQYPEGFPKLWEKTLNQKNQQLTVAVPRRVFQVMGALIK